MAHSVSVRTPIGRHSHRGERGHRMVAGTPAVSLPEERAESAGILSWVEAASGVLFAVLLLVQALLAGNTPAPDKGIANVSNYFANHDTRILWGVYVNLLALFFGLWFASILRGI